MNNFFNIIRNNRLYVIFLLFIVAINLLVLVNNIAEKDTKQESEITKEKQASEELSQPTKETLFYEEDLKTQQEKLRSLADKNPILYLLLVIINLTILFIIFIGILFDIYFLIRWFKKKPLKIRVIDQDTPGWSITDIARVTLIFLFCGYIIIIFQSFIAGLFPILHNENFRMIFNTAMMNIIGISVILYFIVKKYKQNISTIGLTAKKLANNCLYAIVGYISIIPVLFLIMLITFFVTKLLQYKPPVQPIVRVFIEEKTTSILWLSTIFAAIFGPIAEEIFFRGFIYTVFRKKMGMYWAMVTTAVIFSFLHTHIVGFFPIMVLGLLLAYLYEKTGSLVPSIAVHIMHNLGMVILVFIMRYVGG